MTTAWPTETADANTVAPETITGLAGTASNLTAQAERDSSRRGLNAVWAARTRRPTVTIAVRSFTATTLLIVGLLGAGLVGYGTGLAGYRVPSHDAAPRATAIPLDEPTQPKQRACNTLAEAYRSLPEQLRAYQPGQSLILPPTPQLKLADAASGLAELLSIDIGAGYGPRPWPTWLQTLDNYVAALRAVAFVVVQPGAPEPVRAGIAELYQQALTPTLTLCYVSR